MDKSRIRTPDGYYGLKHGVRQYTYAIIDAERIAAAILCDLHTAEALRALKGRGIEATAEPFPGHARCARCDKKKR